MDFFDMAGSLGSAGFPISLFDLRHRNGNIIPAFPFGCMDERLAGSRKGVPRDNFEYPRISQTLGETVAAQKEHA